MKSDLRDVVRFALLLNKFQRVERFTYVAKTKRKENDAEHSFSLAMLAWYLVETLNLKLDREKVLLYALVHDLVEAHAGDVFTFTKDEKLKKQKHKKEEKARLRIKKNFPEFKNLHKYIADYEKQKDKESIFVKRLDKFIPILINYIDDGRAWKKANLSLAEIIDNKRKSIGDNEEIRDLFEQIVTMINKNPKKYFN